MRGHNQEAAASAGDLMHTHIHHYVFRHTMERRTDPILAHTMLGSGDLRIALGTQSNRFFQ